MTKLKQYKRVKQMAWFMLKLITLFFIVYEVIFERELSQFYQLYATTKGYFFLICTSLKKLIKYIAILCINKDYVITKSHCKVCLNLCFSIKQQKINKDK